MEDWMNFHRLGKFQLDDKGIQEYAFNRKGSYVAVVQFNSRTSSVQVLGIKPHLISNEVTGIGSTTAVCLTLIDSLDDKYFFSKVVGNLFYLLGKFVDICQLNSVLGSDSGAQRLGGFESQAGVLTTIGEERGSQGSRRGGVVGGELSARSLFSPVILYVVDEGTEVVFHDRICSFCLAIGLGVVRGGELGIDSQVLAEVIPHLRGKLGTSIRGKTFRQAVELEDISIEGIRGFFDFY